MRENVSILVLLEAALLGPRLYVEFNVPKCFNPCFTGSGSFGEIDLLKILSAECFNPCFTGSGSFGLFRQSNFYAIVQFQSLFYWKRLFWME